LGSCSRRSLDRRSGVTRRSFPLDDPNPFFSMGGMGLSGVNPHESHRVSDSPVILVINRALPTEIVFGQTAGLPEESSPPDVS